MDATSIFDGSKYVFQAFVFMLTGDEVGEVLMLGKGNAAIISTLQFFGYVMYGGGIKA